MSYELKIKAKSLGAESRMIRQEEMKLKKRVRWSSLHQNHDEARALEKTRKSLYEHRTWDVRRESRATNLARAFIKGKPYRTVESKTNTGAYEMAYILGRVEKLVRKYAPLGGDVDTRAVIQAWLET